MGESSRNGSSVSEKVGGEEEVVVGMESDAAAAASGRSTVVCSIVDVSMAASEQRITVQRRGRKRTRRRLEVWVLNIFWTASVYHFVGR